MNNKGLSYKESLRLKYLKDANILDTEPEKMFDDIVVVAKAIMDSKVALVSLIDDNRQWFKAKVGTDLTETDRDISFCQHALYTDEPLIISDIKKDNRFSDNPMVKNEPFVRFYAGFQLMSADKKACYGTLCVIDDTPRSISQEKIKAMKILASHVESLIEVRKKSLNTVSQVENTIAELKNNHQNRQDLLSQILFLEKNMKLMRDELKQTGLENSTTSASVLQISILKLNNLYNKLMDIEKKAS